MFVFLSIVALLTTIYLFLKFHVYNYWEKRGVTGPKPNVLFGNVGECLLMRKSPGQLFTDIYKEFDNVPVVGIYRTHSPALIIRDPELIKSITVKEFSNFHDNDIDIDVKVDPLFGRNPFVLNGELWKTIRTQLTPCFTSGKMKAVYPILEQISEQLVNFIKKQEDAFNGKGLEAKELCTKFTLNNVASCAFGLEGKCFEDPNSKFRQLAHRFLTPNGLASLTFFFAFSAPSISKLISLKFTPSDVEKELQEMVSQTLKYRKENNIVRNDFLHILSQLKETSKEYKFTDVDITAQAAGFFGDGYETSSLVMSYLLFELAANPDAQEKLREEIQQKSDENNGKLPCEVLSSMPYLDAVFNESLRLHPAIFATVKRCTRSCTLDNPKVLTKPLHIEKDTAVILPTYGLQHDSKYWEDPESFVPERFLGENKDKITKFTYLPFGEGPRICLGQRFGVLQIKTGIVHIIKNFEVTVNKKTQLPLKYNKIYFMILPEGGLWIDFKRL